MSWFQRWFGPKDALREAERLLERGEYARCLAEVDGVGGEEAEALRRQARVALAQLNAAEAEALAARGSFDAAVEHLELAARFAGDQVGHGPERDEALAEVLTAARRAVREARSTHRGGPRRPSLPDLAETARVATSPDDGVWALPPDDPRVVWALELEAYPAELRFRLQALGPELGQLAGSVARDPAGVARALGPFVEREPCVLWIRGRAWWAAGELGAAAGDLVAFGDRVGHHRLAGLHSAGALAQVWLQAGRPGDAREAVERGLAGSPDDLQLQAVKAHVLEAQGRLAEADELGRALVARAPSDLGLYRLLGRVRMRAGLRSEARQALEAGLTTCCSSGRCGSQPFDVEAGRMLAQLYLEDRVDGPRAAEVLARLKAQVGAPTWFEHYLDLLAARNRGELELATAGARRLAEGFRPGDPRRRMIEGAVSAG